ncbi:sirohydrochlorin chelatase [Puniceicoccus vermicola]|uniref:Cobalamin biosynthesis protein CbiX n=1 Tax=Puniceicoccus vermicola TaxID=388746 RepID=A0A7X1E2V9_9BACT|nr:CbiX/SirB N-terminal domain-containing protein [Puniceicoccus vermicola]MBC2600875.1 cobalamin biosynthesis protein CbiX [Puniceicoccus vermicola]
MIAGGAKAPLFLLTDNGSIRPASALALRAAAEDLSNRTGQTVMPASLAHCHRIPAEELGGTPARRLKETLLDPSLPEERPVFIIPFFLANRGAIVRLVEQAIAETREERPQLSVELLPYLFEEDGAEQEILARAGTVRVREQIRPSDTQKPTVVLVDHGSPYPGAAQVRNFVAGQVQAFLHDEVHTVIPASMERRDGDEYAFTDPLLEEVLRRPHLSQRPLILLMFFLLPGRHAGHGGDVAEICEEAIEESPSLEIRTTELLGDHPILLEALAKRVIGALGNG